MPTPTLLVVEDNPVTRKLVAASLRREGFRVVEAPDGATALDLFEQERPDLALIDIMLPDIDGWEIAAALHHRADVVPLLALTGCLSKVDEGRLSSSAFSDIVTKPVDVGQLVSTVRAYLPAVTANQGEGTLAGRRVVVADDDPVQQKLLAFHLRRLGCDIEGVPDGAEALAAVRRQRPDAVISDIMMPRLDGFGLCMAIRQDPSLTDLPIVLTTNTYFDSADRALGEKAGADAFVTRTPQMTDVLDALRAVIERPRDTGVQPETPELNREHAGRLLRQLERQVSRNARLSQHCATLSAELSVLRSISGGLAHSYDMESAMKQALVACFDAGGVATGAIVLDEPNGELRIWTPFEMGESFAMAFAAPAREALLRRLLERTSTTAISAASAATGEERALLNDEELASLLVVPLVHADQRLGALVMASKSSGLIERERTLFAEAIANQIAIAITVQRAFETLEQRVEQRTAELQTARSEAERANRAKTGFLSAVSHDLRTPLNAILGFAQLLEGEALSGENADNVRQILSAGRHLLDLINEVIDITRIESGQLQLALESLDSATAIDEAVELIRPLARHRGLTVTLERGHDVVAVRADRQRLKQVLLNLLSNAVKYNRPEGRITISRTVTAEGACRITVTDTGRGIAADKQPLLFTPFQRLGAERTGIEGTGLGLSLAQALAVNMGGALGVHSREGEGSSFWIDLPIVHTAVTSVSAAAPRTDCVVPQAAGTVLYIEDNVANLRLMERMLARRAGVTLLHAASGMAAFALLEQRHPDLILLDVQLPDMSGADVLQRLKQDVRTRAIPVIVLTADATPELPGRFAAAGAAGFVTKPIDIRQMLEVIDSSMAVGH